MKSLLSTATHYDLSFTNDHGTNPPDSQLFQSDLFMVFKSGSPTIFVVGRAAITVSWTDLEFSTVPPK